MRLGVSVPTVLAGSMLLGGLGLVGGCAENRSSLFIAAAMYIDPTGTECVADPSGDVTTIADGVIDLAIRTSYTAPLLIANQLYSVGNGALLRTETNRIQIESADITVEAISGSGGDSYRIPVSGLVDVGDDEPGQSGIFVDLVPEGVITQEGQYIIKVKVNGRTLGGTPIQSGEWLFPLVACTGCLRVCPPEGETELVRSPCGNLIGNDYGLDCRAYLADDEDACNGCPGF